MKNVNKLAMIAACSIFLAPAVHAQTEDNSQAEAQAEAQGKAGGFDFVGKIAFGQKSMDLSIRDRSFTPTFNTLDFTLTTLKENFYLSLNHDLSIKDPVGIDPNGLIFYSRTDTNLTFGYSVNNWLGVFAGFRTGETEAKYTGNNGAFGNSSDGFYLGASGSHYIEGRGNFGASLAIAQLDGEVALSEPFVDTSVFLVGAPPPSVITGSALGFSLGLNWTTAVSDNTLFNVDLKIHQYEFEDDVVFGGLDLSYEENFTTFYLGMTHFFD